MFAQHPKCSLKIPSASSQRVADSGGHGYKALYSRENNSLLNERQVQPFSRTSVVTTLNIYSKWAIEWNLLFNCVVKFSKEAPKPFIQNWLVVTWWQPGRGFLCTESLSWCFIFHHLLAASTYIKLLRKYSLQFKIMPFMAILKHNDGIIWCICFSYNIA